MASSDGRHRAIRLEGEVVTVAQIVEFKTSNLDAMLRLDRQSRDATEGRRTTTAATMTGGEPPDKHPPLVEFPPARRRFGTASFLSTADRAGDDEGVRRRPDLQLLVRRASGVIRDAKPGRGVSV
jgi:hypothetical protein